MFLTAQKFFVRFLIVLFAFAPLSAAAQSAYDIGDDAITAGLLGHFDASGSYDIPLGDWFRRTFGDKEKPLDLYLLMYTQVKEKPRKLALKRVLDGKELTDEEKTALREGRDISLLQGEGFDRVAVLDAQDAALREFAIEDELARMETEIEAEIAATEIFANGDLSDSGFDLLADLNIINIILFGEPTSFFGSSGVGAPPGAKEIDLAKILDTERKRKAEGEAVDDIGEEDGPSEDATDRARRGENALAGGQIDPAMCLADGSLEAALDRFSNTSFAGRREEDAASVPDDSQTKGALGSSGSAAAAATQSGDVLDGEPPADWKREPFCNDRFCVTVEFINKTESARPAAANCVACHIERINDAYRKTTSHNLIPSKATGNLLEIPVCKKGFRLSSLINFNVITIPSPILTPQNDDIVVKYGFFDELDRFVKKYMVSTEKTVGGSKSGNSKQAAPDPTVSAQQRAISNADEKTSVSDIVRDINAEVAAQRAQAFEVLKQYKVLVRARNYGDNFQAVGAELDTAVAYFKSFQELFSRAKIPCRRLQDKSYCQ